MRLDITLTGDQVQPVGSLARPAVRYLIGIDDRVGIDIRIGAPRLLVPGDILYFKGGPIHGLHRMRPVFQPGKTAVADGGFSRIAFFCSDENDTAGTPCTINS